MGNSSFLSKELVDALNQINFHFLYLVSITIRPGTICSSWLNNKEIGLTGALAMEWDLFCRSLMGASV